MARGEPRMGGNRWQNTGSTQEYGPRGGYIVPRTIVVPLFLAAALPATAANYNVIFWTAPNIPRQPADDNTGSNAGIVSQTMAGSATPPEWKVVSIYERHEAAATDSGTVTLQVVKVPSGTAISGGTAIHDTPISLKTTAATQQVVTPSATDANLKLNPGDGLALIPTGTLTALAGLTVMVELRRI